MKLTKTVLILLLSFASVPALTAQTADNDRYNYVRPGDEQGDAITSNILSLGFGMGGYYPYMGTSAVETPNISLLYENTLIKNTLSGNINLGGLFSYKSIYSNYQDYIGAYTYRQRWDYYITGARISYHVSPFADKRIELYGGAMLGYYITSFKFTTNDPNYTEPGDPGYTLTDNSSPNFFALSIYAGARSWITPHSSVWIELGYGYTSMAFGASYKI